MWYGKCINVRCPKPSDFRSSEEGPVQSLFYCTGCGRTYRLVITEKNAVPAFEELRPQPSDEQKS